MVAARVYVVGAGPGDPGLITVRGRQVLEEADVVLHDALVDPGILALAPEHATRVNVGKTPGSPHADQRAIDERLIREARAGRVVVRLKGGDPFLFARGFEEVLALSRADIPFEVVPGVCSPLAAAAYAGIPLTHRGISSSVLITTGHAAGGTPPLKAFGRMAASADTFVVLMGMRHIDALCRALQAGGRSGDTPVAIVHRATLADQKTLVGRLDRIAEEARDAGLTSPAVIIVGPTVGLREGPGWLESRPLFGKTILLPRAREQAGRFGALLRREGALPLEVPAIRIVPPDDAEPVRRAVLALPKSYDVVVFTSANAALRMLAAVREAGGDARRFGGVSICAIGPGTAQALREHGLAADVVPAEHRGEAAAEAILALGRKPQALRVLVPRAAKGREALVERLRTAGAVVDVVAVYQTLGPDEAGAEALRSAVLSADAVLITSGSTIENLVSVFPPSQGAEVLAGRVVASIGPVTTEAAARLGVRVDVTASEATIPHLIAALCGYFKGSS